MFILCSPWIKLLHGSKLGQKGGATPRPKQRHPLPQRPPFSNKYRLATGSPPAAHKQSSLNHAASSRKKRTQLLHSRSATLPTQDLNQSCVGGIAPPHLHFAPSSSLVQPYGALDCTGVHCLTCPYSCHAHPHTSPCSKVTLNQGHAHQSPVPDHSPHQRSMTS
jgi:hypothetical protein